MFDDEVVAESVIAEAVAQDEVAVPGYPCRVVNAVVVGLEPIERSDLAGESDCGSLGLGVSNPRDWSLSDWVSDVVPHVAYGWVTTATYAAMKNRHEDE